eukprot:TRINITY_DN76600_c0_g1_i1.p2 TRINITY_DN76600_c0_g1~~TRINITY_DN76600_c0_g1_i1.p2  ORF type:complete len:132 (-),score=4.06 TRINITY_DN76600_c0_g1_i1:290-685(-)
MASYRAALAVIVLCCHVATAAATSNNANNLRRSAVNKRALRHKSCCDKCPGKFCSPETGACYGSRSVDYLQCPGVPNVPCCDRCAGQYCSPISGACHGSQEKDYYEFCPTVSAETAPTNAAEEALWPYLAV